MEILEPKNMITSKTLQRLVSECEERSRKAIQSEQKREKLIEK